MGLSEISDLHLGKAGEHRVISELILRGFNPCVPCVDHGVDIMLDDGRRIQVKTSQIATTCKHYKNGIKTDVDSRTYNFTLCHGKEGWKLNEIFDFLICYVVPKDCFYIFPKEVLKNKKTICVNIKDRVFYNNWNRKEVDSVHLKYKDNWDLLRKEVKNAL